RGRFRRHGRAFRDLGERRLPGRSGQAGGGDRRGAGRGRRPSRAAGYLLEVMMMVVAPPHVPVLIGPLLRAVEPVTGVWVDGTLGAGGYARALIAAGAERVIGIDRDPDVIRAAQDWDEEQLTVVEGRFGALDRIAAEAGVEQAAGVVLDIGVSSMQLDEAERGFSFLRDG